MILVLYFRAEHRNFDSDLSPVSGAVPTAIYNTINGCFALKLIHPIILHKMGKIEKVVFWSLVLDLFGKSALVPAGSLFC